MKKVLFVCLGNICRSPAAEGIFTEMTRKAGLKDQVEIDSAGTSAHHAGEAADSRMQEHADRRGYPLKSLARGFDSKRDFEYFDYILTMDNSNYKNVLALDSEGRFSDKVKKMVSFCTDGMPLEVPDPYFGGPKGFDEVLDILEDACHQLLEEISEALK